MFFGSFARGEETVKSDIDVIVEFSLGKRLLDIIGIEQDLEELVGRKLQLVSDKWLNPRILDRITQEMIIVER